VQTDGDFLYNAANTSAFNNAGTIDKTAGTGSSNLPGLPFDNVPGGIARAETGTLNLSGGGTSTGGTYVAASGAAVNITGGSTATWDGTFTGAGSGAIILNSGALQSGADGVVFNFPTGLFQWQGGTLSGTFTNTGDLVLNGGTMFLTGATLTNNATIEQVGGQVQFRAATINNAVTGIYNVRRTVTSSTTSPIRVSSPTMGCLRRPRAPARPGCRACR